METQPKIVCLCGSVRFREHFEKVDEFFTLNGWIVVQPGCWKHEELHNSEDLDMLKKKAMLDRLHRAKIEMSDLVFLVNPEGYIGHSTCQEIDHAKFLGKPIEALENGSKNWIFGLSYDQLQELVK